MVVHDFRVHGMVARLTKADSPLIVDPDAVLSGAVTLQDFEPIFWRNLQILQPPRLVEVQEFAARDPLDGPEPRHGPVAEQRRDPSIAEGPNHPEGSLFKQRVIGQGRPVGHWADAGT